MNPRVSRSSAPWPSKATGFPIAKIAAKLAVGYTLDELPNDITRETKACFEPSIDYVVTKVPRWTFEKFPEADATLTIQMKSVGETMAIGRTFKESLQKALRGTETGHFGLGGGKKDLWGAAEQPGEDAVVAGLATPNEHRMSFLRYAYQIRDDARTNPRTDRHRPVVPGPTLAARGNRGGDPGRRIALRRHRGADCGAINGPGSGISSWPTG